MLKNSQTKCKGVGNVSNNENKTLTVRDVKMAYEYQNRKIQHSVDLIGLHIWKQKS